MYMESGKMVLMNLFAGDGNGDTDTESKLVDTAGEGEEGANGESSAETHTSPYVKQPASGNSL